MIWYVQAFSYKSIHATTTKGWLFDDFLELYAMKQSWCSKSEKITIILDVFIFVL